MDELAKSVERPERFLGTHWFNPPEWTPGVEVIPASTTDPGVVDKVVASLRAIGKRPTAVGDGPGFVANRIQMALFLEALRCVEEGLASPQQVDEVVRSCFGFRDRKSTRLNSSHANISYAVFCLKKKNTDKRSCDICTIFRILSFYLACVPS